MLTRFQEDQLLIQQLRAEVERLTQELTKWQRIRTPTHGTCCTCQRCGQSYDDCRCDLDIVADELTQAKQRVEQLERIVTSYKTDREQELEEALAQAQQQINELQDAHRILQNEGQRLAEARLATAQAEVGRLRDVLNDVIASVTITYADQAEKHLTPEHRGTARVWSDAGCWLYPGDVIYEVSADIVKRMQEAQLMKEQQLHESAQTKTA